MNKQKIIEFELNDRIVPVHFSPRIQLSLADESKLNNWFVFREQASRVIDAGFDLQRVDDAMADFFKGDGNVRWLSGQIIAPDDKCYTTFKHDSAYALVVLQDEQAKSVDQKHYVVLVTQTRSGQTCTEPPGGMILEGQSVLETAVEEVEQEAPSVCQLLRPTLRELLDAGQIKYSGYVQQNSTIASRLHTCEVVINCSRSYIDSLIEASAGAIGGIAADDEKTHVSVRSLKDALIIAHEQPFLPARHALLNAALRRNLNPFVLMGLHA